MKERNKPMTLNTRKIISIELTDKEKEALEIAHDIIAGFNNNVVYVFEEQTYQSPLYGDCIELDELSRVVGVLDFFRNNPVVHAINPEE
jgi:DNA-binding XRE family transcriptional regulator